MDQESIMPYSKLTMSKKAVLGSRIKQNLILVVRRCRAALLKLGSNYLIFVPQIQYMQNLFEPSSREFAFNGSNEGFR